MISESYKVDQGIAQSYSSMLHDSKTTIIGLHESGKDGALLIDIVQ